MGGLILTAHPPTLIEFSNTGGYVIRYGCVYRMYKDTFPSVTVIFIITVISFTTRGADNESTPESLIHLQ